MSYEHLFPRFPDAAQLWVYVSDRPLSRDVQENLLGTLEHFLAGWQSHGAPVTAAAEILDDRFLLVAGYLEDDHVSGCGIDASTRALHEAASAHSVTWAPSLDVLFRNPEGSVQNLSRVEFRQLAQSGTIPASTPVFDPSITTVGALRSGKFEMPAEASWQSRYFARSAA